MAWFKLTKQKYWREVTVTQETKLSLSSIQAMNLWIPVQMRVTWVIVAWKHDSCKSLGGKNKSRIRKNNHRSLMFVGYYRTLSAMLDSERKPSSELYMLETQDKSEVVKGWPREAARAQIISSKQILSPCCKSPFNRGEKNQRSPTLRLWRLQFRL